MKKQWHIFSDFDGTIAQNDVGAQLFIQYGNLQKCKEAVADWMHGKISSREMYWRECATANVTPDQLIALAGKQKIDPEFTEFYTRCKKQGYDTTILSDGFQVYIEQIFENHALPDLEIKANNIKFINGTQIEPCFPHNTQSCGHCANCKGFHIREFRKQYPGVGVVLIGDGYSDRCGAQEADIIIAKNDLATYCIDQNLTYSSFRNFADVIENCKTLGLLN